MKKTVKWAAILVIVMLLASCNWKTNVRNSGIPQEYKTLEFWNGGGLMAKYSDVAMAIEIVSTEKIVGADVYFYKYHVYSTPQGIDEWIIDSESLALKYTVIRVF